MSPAKFNVDEDPARRVIHGPRPSPLKINKDSHFIHKTSSSSSSSSILDVAPVAVKQQQPQKRQQPVIIYTYSPKIIHTQPRDFMALVQKLTGQYPTEGRGGGGNGNGNGNDSASLNQKESRSSRKIMAGGSGGVSRDNDNESSSVLTSDEINGGGGSGGGGDSIKIGNSNSSSTLTVSNPFFGDIPLFTPNGGHDFFCSPRPVYRFQDTLSSSPNMGASLSPSFLEFMKGLPDY